MHYGDIEQLDNNTLILVVYKHVILNEKNKFDYRITSIHKCKYFPPMMLLKILTQPNKFFKKLLNKTVDPERYYQVMMRIADRGSKRDYLIETIEIKDVSDTENKFHTLH